MRSGKAFVAGLVIGSVIAPLALIGYFYFGYAPVAADATPMPLEKFLAHRALHARVERELPPNAPAAPTEQDLLSAARSYREDCAVCHGLPGQSQSAIAKGMFPRPPELFKGKGVTDDPVGETYWKVRNGIRLSGMPSFMNAMPDSDIWQVSQLVANAQNLPPSVQQELARPDTQTISRLAQPH